MLAQLLAGRSLIGTICRHKEVIFKQLVNTSPTSMSFQDKFTEPSNEFSVVCSYLMQMRSLISQIVNIGVKTYSRNRLYSDIAY